MEKRIKKSRIDECGDDDGPSTSKKQRLDTWAYNRCRKPFGDPKTCSTKSLRAASQIIVEKFNAKFTIDPPLTTSDRLCYSCRTKIHDLCKTPESSQSKFYKFNIFPVLELLCKIYHGK